MRLVGIVAFAAVSGLVIGCDWQVKFDVINDLPYGVRVEVLNSTPRHDKVRYLAPQGILSFSKITGQGPWSGDLKAYRDDGSLVFAGRWHLEDAQAGGNVQGSFCTFHIVERIEPTQTLTPTCVGTRQSNATSPTR